MQSNHLKNAIFLLVSCGLSGIGTGITLLAIPWFLVEQSDTNAVIGILYIFSQLATFILLPVFSKIVDRNSRKINAIVYLAVGAMIQLISLSLLLNRNIEPIGVLAFSGLISFILRAFDQLNRNAWAKELVAPTHYRHINRWLEICRQTITFVAGGLSIYIFRKHGLNVIFFIDAITYLVGILFVFQIQSQTSNSTSINSNKKEQVEINESLRWVIRRNLYSYAWCFLALFPYVFVMVNNAIIPGFFFRDLRVNSENYAVSSIGYGVGALFGAVLEKKFGQIIKSQKLFIMVQFIFSFGYIFLAISRDVIFVNIILAVLAAFHVWVRIDRSRWIMEITPNTHIGRIQGIYDNLSLGMIMLLTFSITHLSDHVGSAVSFTILGTVSGLLCVVFLLMKAFNKITSNKYVPDVVNQWV